ncbi:hypothetical protein Tco_1409125 [Tanacetum coccineum]
MSVGSNPRCPELPDYVVPSAATSDSDNDIIEGPSRISLNCPIRWDFIRVTILAFFGSLEVFLELLCGTMSDHRLVEDHEKRPMGIFWNLYMSLMYADDVTFAEFSLCAKDLQVYSWSSKFYTFYISVCIRFCNFALSKIDLPTSVQFLYGICYCKWVFWLVGHVSIYAEQRCLLAQCMLKVYVEIAKSPKCIIVLLTHGLLACNMICCMAFGTSELNGFTKGVWNRFNTMSRLENLSDNWTDAISGVSIRLANTINCWVFIGRVFLDNYGFRLDGNLGWRNSWLNEELTHQERAVLHVLVTYFLLRSDHRLVKDHEKRPMGIFWNRYMSLMYADDVTFCNFALSKIDLPTFQFSSVGHVSVYAEQRCLLAQCILKVYVEIAKSPMCIIVLLTHGFLACNLICCMAFGTSELNGFTKGVWNKFNTMSRLENLSNNWTDAISGVSIRLANSDNGGYLYFYMDCLGNGVPWVISCTIVLLS